MTVFIDLDAMTAESCAEQLISLAHEGAAEVISDDELLRRIDAVVNPFISRKGPEASASRRVRLVQALRARCRGPGCDRVAAHILGNG